MSRRKNMMRLDSPGSTAKQLVQVAKALGHPTRLRILAMVQGRALCVCQMTALLGGAASTVSGHLNELRRSGLVVEDKQGKLVFYRLDGSSPFAALVTNALASVGDDEAISLDRALIERVRAVPIEVLTRPGPKLDLVGTKRSAFRARARS
jgi:ArsR family transcriptional regulator, arsenate/arsenite/antimonite-responsive transcriptional repressor